LILQLVSIIVAVIAANFLSCRHWKPIDFSKNNDFTLSSLTTKTLNSEVIAKRSDPIKMIVAYRRSAPFSSRIRKMAETYEHAAHGKIDVEYVDPLRNPNRAQEIESIYHTVFTEDKIIIDARATGEVAATKIPEADLDLVNAPNKTYELSSHIRFLTAEQLFVYDVNKEQGRHIVGYRDEDAITSALLTAAEGKPRRIYLLADKSDVDFEDKNSPWYNLTTTLYHQNVALIPLSLSNIESIPKDADGIALIAPKYDFDDRELKIFTNYWERPRSSIFITLDPPSRPAKLKTFLRSHGVTPRNDRVVTVKNNQTVTIIRSNFTLGPEPNKDLEGQASVFEGKTCSLEVREKDENLLNQRILAIPLIAPAKDYWGETRFGQGVATYDENEDITGSDRIPIAASVMRGNANDEKLAEQTSRLVVIGNTDFLKAGLLREEQLDFVNSVVNWLIGREELIGVGPRQITAYKLNLVEEQTGTFERIILFIMPLIAAFFAFLTWRLRRS